MFNKLKTNKTYHCSTSGVQICWKMSEAIVHVRSIGIIKLFNAYIIILIFHFVLYHE